MKKGERKKPQRGRAARVTPRDNNFQSAEKPQGSRNCEGGKGKVSRLRDLSGAPEARYLKGRQKVRRECRDVARVKPSDGQGAEQPGAKLRG